LLPSQKNKIKIEQSESDLANGLVQPGLSVLASLSARVGSIAQNERGGWYSYRSSKAALNQIIVTLQRELNYKSTSPTIALALHPGTIAGTELSRPYVKESERGSKHGVHGPEEAAEYLFRVIGKAGKDDGGKFMSFDGEEIPW